MSSSKWDGYALPTRVSTPLPFKTTISDHGTKIMCPYIMYISGLVINKLNLIHSGTLGPNQVVLGKRFVK